MAEHRKKFQSCFLRQLSLSESKQILANSTFGNFRSAAFYFCSSASSALKTNARGHILHLALVSQHFATKELLEAFFNPEKIAKWTVFA